MALSKDQIIGANDLVAKEIEVPEWGGSVYLRVPAYSEHERFDALLKGEPRTYVVKVCQLTICDQLGRVLFEEDELEQLASKSFLVLLRLATEAIKLLGLGGAKVDDAEKKLEPIQTSDSV